MIIIFYAEDTTPTTQAEPHLDGKSRNGTSSRDVHTGEHIPSSYDVHDDESYDSDGIASSNDGCTRQEHTSSNLCFHKRVLCLQVTNKSLILAGYNSVKFFVAG